MCNYTNNLRYTIAKHIPDMERGFKISTNYGDFFIEADEAEPIIKQVRKAVEKNLSIALLAEAKRRPS
jgi:hypothetical protein